MPSLVLLLGGKGSRFGGKKQFLTYKGRFLFEYLLDRVSDLFSEIVLVVPEGDLSFFKEKYRQYKIAVGGEERQYSVYNGLKLVSEPIVAIHDGARPFASRQLFERLLNLENCDGKIPVLPLRDTVKRVSPEGVVLETLKRGELVAVQTPQVFKTKLLKWCHEKALKEHFFGTDDASLLERCGYKICTEKGEFFNFKITYPEDWEIAKCLLDSNLLEI
jgi:2-C-methyl-D-erythritol 4-phosphate cytidylyltransferase